MLDIVTFLIFYLPIGIISWIVICLISYSVYKNYKKEKKKNIIESLNRTFFKKDNFKNFKDWEED